MTQLYESLYSRSYFAPRTNTCQTGCTCPVNYTCLALGKCGIPGDSSTKINQSCGTPSISSLESDIAGKTAGPPSSTPSAPSSTTSTSTPLSTQATPSVDSGSVNKGGFSSNKLIAPIMDLYHKHPKGFIGGVIGIIVVIIIAATSR